MKKTMIAYISEKKAYVMIEESAEEFDIKETFNEATDIFDSVTSFMKVKRIKDDKICEAGIHFAEMLGIMETLNEMPEHTIEKARKSVTEWAKEFVTDGSNDLSEYFQKKLNQIK